MQAGVQPQDGDGQEREAGVRIRHQAPKRIISGSFANCDSPPESVITVATITAVRIVAICVAANAATQSCACGGPFRAPIGAGRSAR